VTRTNSLRSLVATLGTTARQARSLWPQRADSLPEGQRALDAFPRFADDPRRPPPRTPPTHLSISSPALGEMRVAFDELRTVDLVSSRTSDFHCVTTWSARGQTWTGVPLAAWWRARHGELSSERFAVVGAADGYRAVFRTDDLFADDVLLAWSLNGEPLDARHGAPLRLVSPSQYGYENVKHVESIELRVVEPPSALGPKEHLRARVAFEERHTRVPGRVLRWPYRLVVPLTAMVAERTLERSAGSDRRPGETRPPPI
jgi:DMSO/TMAO reductase YedYZ molybdopterin-dependent catalytic subunit